MKESNGMSLREERAQGHLWLVVGLFIALIFVCWLLSEAIVIANVGGF